jgi:hypothetical protein
MSIKFRLLTYKNYRVAESRTWVNMTACFATLTLCPRTFRPLITTTRTSRPQKVANQIHADQMTLRLKSGGIIRPSEIVALWPYKVGRIVRLTGLFGPNSRDTTSLFPTWFPLTSPRILGYWCFFLLQYFALLKSFCMQYKLLLIGIPGSALLKISCTFELSIPGSW